MNSQFEVGDASEDYIQQILIKYALKCEICQVGKSEQANQPQNQVKLLVAKVTTQQPVRKSHIVICPNHFQQFEDDLQKFLAHSKISYQVQQADIKKAKLVTIHEIKLSDAINAIKNNYCCRILKQRLFKIEKQIQILNCDNIQETIENVFEQKKKALEITEIKFKTYVENQNRMSIKQKFLIYHFYQRLLRKSKTQIDQKSLILEGDQPISTLSMSMSMSVQDMEAN